MSFLDIAVVYWCCIWQAVLAGKLTLLNSVSASSNDTQLCVFSGAAKENTICKPSILDNIQCDDRKRKYEEIQPFLPYLDINFNISSELIHPHPDRYHTRNRFSRK